MENKNHAPLWHGRFTQAMSEAALSFETSIHVDSRMAFDDITGSIAHARMLLQIGVLQANEAERIIAGLNEIKAELTNGSLQIDKSAEDIHSFIEATLTDKIGEAAKKIHTGRSRNDQIALDERLYVKRVIPDLQKKIMRLIETLCTLAKQHTKTLMPGFTHMQHAQPVTLSHHLLAWAWSFTRDYTRLRDALVRADESPIGAAALAGSSLPLDRFFEANELGFAKPTENSLDSVSDRDYFLELTSCFALLHLHLSRASEEIVLWSTSEFGFVELSEAWSTGSSLMPQKKNPDFAELIRGKTGSVYGSLIALFTMMKGLPLSYNRDMQEDKEHFFRAFDTVSSCIEIFCEMVKSAKWNCDKMQRECERGFLNATDVAEYLVQKNVPFRSAHEIAAGLVRLALEKQCTLEELALADFKAASPLFESDIISRLSSRACLNARNTFGAPCEERVREQITHLEEFVAKNR